MDREGPTDHPLTDFAVPVAEAAEAVAAAWTHSSRVSSPRLPALQLEALLIARRNPGINLTGLAEQVGTAPPAVSRLCDRLEAAGLLRRQPARTSRREIGLVLTPAGHDLIDAVFARRYAAFGDVLQHMAPTERADLLAGLLAFSRAAHAAAPPGNERG
ncbi:MarR family transcriptional regulator [Streptomyces sp. H27-C3]|uniref:MarR family winged helix-turn-helix transcriptional regulator n=1 Tax=Streptomyces sp. H27-C3 TaxID=3046305 RepID=UPI0024BA917B|nr:MarR family transcriptional regulator [Streptomyces sp. H27-C3]MDJ0462490.1 MarR family transcriptional regulator [Streptomyces sp. H27-C3]